MKKQTPGRTKSSDAKRITRMHQMEQMEAAARGTVPTYTLNTRSFDSTDQPPAVVAAQTQPSTEQGDFLSNISTTLTVPTYSKPSPGSGGLFSKRDIYEVDQTINLMDASSKQYAFEEEDTGRKSASFLDIFLGGSGNTSGSSHSSDTRRNSIQTSWKTSTAGRMLIGCFFVSFVAVIALTMPLFIVNSNDAAEAQQRVRTQPPRTDANEGVEGVGGSEAAASGSTTFATLDYDANVENTERFDELKNVLLQQKATLPDRLQDKTSSAFFALRWLTDDDPMQLESSDPALFPRFALASLFYATHQPTSATKQRQALDLSVDKFNTASSTGSAPWKRENAWMTQASVCEWYGVVCELDPDTKESVVVHLNVTSNHLGGTIPMELQALDQLILLDLSDNQLSGSIPSQLGNLKQIQYLLLHKNSLVGSIPQELETMKEAYEIYLSHNQLTGSVPMSLGNLENLIAMDLGHNKLTGRIDNWKGFTNINHLHLNDNRLEGPLPSTFGQLSMLNDLRLENNQLTGKLSLDLAKNTKLRLLYLANNNFEGQIPDIFDQLHQLTDLQLHGNNFRSQLPRTMGSLTSLRRLTLEGNNGITGHLPTEWSKMTELEALDLYHNEIVGTIPTEFGELTNLLELELGRNFLQGEIPSELGLLTNLKSLELQHNALKGQVPSEFGNMKSLEKLNLAETMVTGTVPEEICERDFHLFEANCKSKLECACCTKCY